MLASLLLHLSPPVSERPAVHAHLPAAAVGEPVPGDERDHHNVPGQQCHHTKNIWRTTARHSDQRHHAEARRGRGCSICRNISCVRIHVSRTGHLEVIPGVEAVPGVLQ